MKKYDILTTNYRTRAALDCFVRNGGNIEISEISLNGKVKNLITFNRNGISISDIDLTKLEKKANALGIYPYIYTCKVCNGTGRYKFKTGKCKGCGGKGHQYHGYWTNVYSPWCEDLE